MKVIIIGSSIAGTSLAYFLADKAEVVVYEQKSRENVGKKVCANIYTHKIKEILKDFNLNPNNFIKNTYTEFKVFSKNNSALFRTEEYEFNRQKLLEALIKKAERKGVKFFFKASFYKFEKKNKKFIVHVRRNNSIILDSADILVGADGAASSVAKCSGLWENRKLFLALQTKVRTIKNKRFLPKRNSYNIFLGSSFGYYAYIFSLKKGYIVGLEDYKERNVKKKFENFLNFLKTKANKIEGALIPEPKVIKPKSNIFLIGDAGCQVKFSGGGVIPAMLAAKAVKEIIINNNWKIYKNLSSAITLNRLATKFFNRMSDKRADNLIEIVKARQFKDIPKYRDYLNEKHFRGIFNPKLIFSIILNLFA